MKLKSAFWANIHVTAILISATLGSPCQKLLCGFVEPVCPQRNTYCGCRCNNTVQEIPQPPPQLPQLPSPPSPCGTTYPEPVFSEYYKREFSVCQKPVCPCGQRPACLSMRRWGEGCICKCIKASDGCSMPFGPYECIHACNRCMCWCVADPPFKRPPSTCCKPVTG
ncbi:uncharacterized protein LOC142790166 [Rhipicephalus microplus]|uniref:Putative conserved secreted protein n=1 Tax=Rhipicephalus microplus TaxID=6941 RepID=A0A6G5A2F6_RHIMP